MWINIILFLLIKFLNCLKIKLFVRPSIYLSYLFIMKTNTNLNYNYNCTLKHSLTVSIANTTIRAGYVSNKEGGKKGKIPNFLIFSRKYAYYLFSESATYQWFKRLPIFWKKKKSFLYFYMKHVTSIYQSSKEGFFQICQTKFEMKDDLNIW